MEKFQLLPITEGKMRASDCEIPSNLQPAQAPLVTTTANQTKLCIFSILKVKTVPYNYTQKTGALSLIGVSKPPKCRSTRLNTTIIEPSHVTEPSF